MRGIARGRRPCNSVSILCSYLLLQHGALGLSQSTKLRRLRGYRESNTKKPPIHLGLPVSKQAAQVATERDLSTMFENKATELHVHPQPHQKMEDGYSRGPPKVSKPQEKIVFHTIEGAEQVAEKDQIGAKDEHFNAHEASGDAGGEINLINKEEPKGLYMHGKSSKPKAKGSQSKNSAELNNVAPTGFEKEEAEGQGEEHEKSQIEGGRTDYIEAQRDELNGHETSKHYAMKPEEEKLPEKPPMKEKLKREEIIEEEYLAEEEPVAEEHIPPLNSAQPMSNFDSTSKPENGNGASPEGEKNKGRGRTKPFSSAPPKVTEIHVGFQYQLKGTRRTASVSDFAGLAKATSHVCDYVFRQYFMDIEEVQFLSTDKLAIYEVKAPNYAAFTIAAYFAADSSLPDQQLLTDIVTKSLLNGSTYYKYYLFLLENLEEKNAFHYASSVELYSQTSKLIGPSENTDHQAQGSPRLFKVAVPIIVLLLFIVVAALIYVTWVESQQLHDEDDQLLLIEPETNYKKILTTNDCDTLPSHGGSSFAERRSFSDDSTSMSGSSARFVDDMSRKTTQVMVSPCVLYRTFNPGDFSQVDFEEVSLQDEEDEKLQCFNLQFQKKVVPPKDSGKEVSMTMTDGFAAVLNSASPEVHQLREAGLGVEVEEISPPRLSPCGAWVKEAPRDAAEIASQLNLHPLDVPIWAGQDLKNTRLKEDINGASKQEEDLSTTMDRLDQECVAKPTFFGPKVESQSPKVALQSMNTALQRMVRQRQLVLTTDTDEVKSFFDDEYEEVLEEEYEEELSVYEEEVLDEEGTSEEAVDGNLAWIEDRLCGVRKPQPQHGSPDDAAKQSPMTAPTLAPRKIRDFWEKQSSKQETAREFWEQKLKPKLSTN